jgi:hypothetical protein
LSSSPPRLLSRPAWRAYYLLPPLLCLIVFRQAPLIWFRNDDFAWLSLHMQVRDLSSLMEVLFRPQAQGTVRVLSERLYFLILTSIFGLHAWPFRLIGLGTWFVNLALIQSIGARLTGSRTAGLLAAMFWTVSFVLVTPLVWASSYNEILLGFFVLSAFYSRMRWLESGESKWRWAEAIFYLLGFGALEVIVVYPAIALAYTLIQSNTCSRWRSTLWMFVPAITFTLLHLVVIPKTESPPYRIIVDRRIVRTLWTYLLWALGPSEFDTSQSGLGRVGLLITWLIGAALLAFLVRRIYQRDYRVLFCCSWFLLLMAPVLPLPNHVSDYYLTNAGIGIAWLAGWAAASAVQRGAIARLGVVVLGIGYVIVSAMQVHVATDWHRRISMRMQELVVAVARTAAEHPNDVLILQGVDQDIGVGGIFDNPFHLVGAERVYFAPGTAEEILNTQSPDAANRYRISASSLNLFMEQNRVRVLDVSGPASLEITDGYKAKWKATASDGGLDSIDVGDAAYSDQLGSGWYQIENHARWMSRKASVRMGGPTSRTQKLYVKGYGAAAALANGPVMLHLRAADTDLGAKAVTQPNEPFELDFELPPDLVRQKEIEITVECSRTLRAPGDARELGMILLSFAIR